jgi:hypothetical protein
MGPAYSATGLFASHNGSATKLSIIQCQPKASQLLLRMSLSVCARQNQDNAGPSTSARQPFRKKEAFRSPSLRMTDFICKFGFGQRCTRSNPLPAISRELFEALVHLG